MVKLCLTHCFCSSKSTGMCVLAVAQSMWQGKCCFVCKCPYLHSILYAGMVTLDFGIMRFGLEPFRRLCSCLRSLGLESKGRHVFLFLPFKCHSYSRQSWLLRRRLMPTSPFMTLLMLSSRLFLHFPICVKNTVFQMKPKWKLLKKQVCRLLNIILSSPKIMDCPMKLHFKRTFPHILKNKNEVQ